MKKWICILGISLILTGCSKSAVELEENPNTIVVEKINSMGYSQEKAMYINDDMKKVIEDINNVRGKYKDGIDEEGHDSFYIDIYEDDYQGIRDIGFDNKSIHSYEYFTDLVEILDEGLAKGLKSYIKEMEDKQLQADEIILEKIGRTMVWTENRRGDEGNYISIKVNFLDVGDEYYRELFNKVSQDKYVLENVIIGEKLNLIDFANSNKDYRPYDSDYFNIGYNMFLEDKVIRKVNILIQGKNDGKIKDDDMDVFTNLLDTLELNKEDKDLLLNEYKNIFENKANNKKISLDNYNVFINATKGNGYSSEDKKLIYFSIERN